MSEMEENVKPMDSESPLDRLVDGELSESDRSELLLQLEHEPEGWRRCALAFLEAQCWKQEFGLMSGAPSNRESAVVAAAVEPSVLPGRTVGQAPWRQRLAMVLSMGGVLPDCLGLGYGNSRLARSRRP